MPKLDRLFDELVDRGGSDLHLGTGYPPHARVGGELVELPEATIDPKELESALLELLSAPQRSRLSVDMDLDFAYAHGDKARFRASYFREVSGLGAVFRLVPTRVRTLAELGCPEVVRRLADRRAGLVIVTGPTGSGRSTTIAAMLDHINKTRACHILTIEDPIEFVHEPLRAQTTHREVGAHASSYAAAMRSAGRENADVVFIADVRGPEEIKLALQLASEGVLVFVALETNGATSTLDGLVDRFPAAEQAQMRSMLAESFAGLVSQQLVSASDGSGRLGVYEILIGSPSVSAILREGKTSQLLNVMQAGHVQGTQTLDMALERLVTQGSISAEEALDCAVEREAFAQVIARVRPDLAEILG